MEGYGQWSDINKKHLIVLSSVFYGRGPGESRTPVQTREPYAFYMLIFALSFRV